MLCFLFLCCHATLFAESPLGAEQMRVMCAYLFTGGVVGDIPHPDANWKLFKDTVRRLNEKSPKIFDPLSGTEKHWIDMKLLTRQYRFVH